SAATRPDIKLRTVPVTSDQLEVPCKTGGVHINGAMKKSNKFSPQVRERAVRMVLEHRGEYSSLWAAIESIAPKIGCVPQTLNEWVRKHEVETGMRDGVTSAERERVKVLEREVKELRKANEILKLASAFFAQAELDRRFKS
ncbi:Transposase, partial [Nitrosospira sp. Nsp18]